MNITKRGIDRRDYYWDGKCYSCGTEVEAKEQELHITDDQRDGMTGSAPCPLCGTTMSFYRSGRIESKVPPREHWHD